MHAKILSATTVGIQAHTVEVEVDLSMGLIRFLIVGLPDKAIQESKERIKAAFKNSGLMLPERFITVNLAPAQLKKQDVLFDVPIAVAILQAGRMINLSSAFINQTFFLGELALDGTMRPVCGVLSIVHHAVKQGIKRVIVPLDNVQEARLIEGIEIIGVKNLEQLVGYLRKEHAIDPAVCLFDSFTQMIENHPLDFSQVKGQWQAKRALQIAAAGKHNVLFIGPPGSGKTMLARRLSSILPPMSFDEVIQTSKIYSVAGALKEKPLVMHRPFRSPHHTISQAGLVGGGSNPRPGEISLAHNGVLFLDELTEFKRTTLEVLRQPLESRRVLIARAQSTIEYPCSFQLIAALNPCPCGFYGDGSMRCSCTSKQVTAYKNKLSGPLLDRIDLHVTVRAVPYKDLKAHHVKGESSEQLRQAVMRAVAIQHKRNGGVSNAALSAVQIESVCAMSPAAEQCLKQAFDMLGLSMRGYHKVLKIARTIADIESRDSIDVAHIQEALSYRCFDREETTQNQIPQRGDE